VAIETGESIASPRQFFALETSGRPNQIRNAGARYRRSLGTGWTEREEERKLRPGPSLHRFRQPPPPRTIVAAAVFLIGGSPPPDRVAENLIEFEIPLLANP
jgi:hypothetical protein